MKKKVQRRPVFFLLRKKEKSVLYRSFFLFGMKTDFSSYWVCGQLTTKAGSGVNTWFNLFCITYRVVRDYVWDLLVGVRAMLVVVRGV